MPYQDESKNKELRRRWRANNREYGSNYARTHRTKMSEYSRNSKRRLKVSVFAAYGGSICACCSETHLEFLSIDHINGGGAAHRRELGGAHYVGTNIYKWLKDHHYPEGFRVLCMNCNFALGHFGYCPHNPTETVQQTHCGRPTQDTLSPIPITLHPSGIVNRQGSQLYLIDPGDS